MKTREKSLRDHIQTEQNNEALSLGFDDEGKMREKRRVEGEVSGQHTLIPDPETRRVTAILQIFGCGAGIDDEITRFYERAYAYVCTHECNVCVRTVKGWGIEQRPLQPRLEKAFFHHC